MVSIEKQGQIITFYSYKGGTGRTMALANVACLLAQNYVKNQDKGVLMIDWDLEAPGLHQFFSDNLIASDDRDVNLEEQKGLIDLFSELEEKTRQEDYGSGDQADQLFDSIKFHDNFIIKTKNYSPDLLTAGRFDEKYSSRVYGFQWEELYKREPWLISSFAYFLSNHYEYILIDSRTGNTDISGICTTLMPEKLVVVFTPNHQSLTGVINLIKRAVHYRKQSNDVRPLFVFPLPSRIDMTESMLLKEWRYGDGEGKKLLAGYQTEFEELFKEVYKPVISDLRYYFNEVQIQHIPSYAYGEKVAALLEPPGVRLSLRDSFEKFAQKLLKFNAPWEDIPLYFHLLLPYKMDELSQVQTIANILLQRRLECVVYKQKIQISDVFEKVVKKIISRVKATIIFINSPAVEPWESLELQGFYNQCKQENIHTIFVLLPNVKVKDEELPSFMRDKLKYVRFRESISNPEALNSLEQALVGKLSEEDTQMKPLNPL